MTNRRAKSVVMPAYVLMESFVERMRLTDQELGLEIFESSYEEEDEIGKKKFNPPPSSYSAERERVNQY